MRRPAMEMSISKDDDEWEYAYFTVDFLILFYLLPERSRDLQAIITLWESLRMDELCAQLNNGYLTLNTGQSFLLLDGSYAIMKWIESGDQVFIDIIFKKVAYRSARFQSANEFCVYYINITKRLISEAKEQFSSEPGVLAQFENVFQRWKTNCTYKEWCIRNNAQHYPFN